MQSTFATRVARHDGDGCCLSTERTQSGRGARPCAHQWTFFAALSLLLAFSTAAAESMADTNAVRLADDEESMNLHTELARLRLAFAGTPGEMGSAEKERRRRGRRT